MPRRPYKKTNVKIEPLHDSYEMAKLINYVMKDGKKSIAQKIVYSVCERMKKEAADPIKILNQAITNVAPEHEVKPKRLGGASYLVPIEVRRGRKLFLALNWIINAAKSRSNKEYKTFAEKLYTELMEASKNLGQAVNKKLQVEKVAEANRAFAHLKW